MKLYTTGEAAKRLGISPVRVRQLIRGGQLKANRIGRDYAISEKNLLGVTVYGKAGRPKKQPEQPKSKAA